jgi:tRNA threonylcarbamoyladenosine biosynthesis protein TsaE
MKKNNLIGKVFFTKDFKETQKLGYNFAKTLEKGDRVCLYGDLGSGKTTFTQGLAKGLGVENRIISPTFVVIKNYRLGDGIFYHIDLYRIGEGENIKELGFQEIMDDDQSIIVIEWAEKLKNNLPEKRIDIKFIYEKDDVRKITFRSSNQ